MLKQIDLTNLNHITFIIILIIIFFCIIYLFKVNKQNASIEGFTQYEIKTVDVVKLYSLDNIIVGGDNTSLLTTLNDVYADKRDYLINKQSIVNGMIQLRKDITDSMNNIKTNIESSISTFRTTITDNTAASISSFETRLTNGITTLKSNITNTPPPLTIVALYSHDIPTGWQLCNGRVLKAIDGYDVFYKITSSGDTVELNTPDLRGRMILGANATYNGDTIVNALTRRGVGIIDGAEKHTLTVDEMPSHNHTHTAYHANFKHSGDPTEGSTKSDGKGEFKVGGDVTGGNKPHNNMPPFYVLNYIIKKPLLGGSSNAIVMTSSPTQPTPTPTTPTQV